MSIASSTTTKPKMSNSLELLTGLTVAEIQKKYEILSAIVIEYSGKVHDSQPCILSNNNSTMSLIVYYEVPEGHEKQLKKSLVILLEIFCLYNREILVKVRFFLYFVTKVRNSQNFSPWLSIE